MKTKPAKPLTTLLSEPLSPAGIDDLCDRLNSEIDKRVAALFVRYDVRPESGLYDTSRWRIDILLLARAVASDKAPWLVPAISECCAWGLLVAMATTRFDGFKSKASVDATSNNAPRKHRGHENLILSTVQAVTGALGSEAKAFTFLESPDPQEPPNAYSRFTLWIDEQRKGDRGISNDMSMLAKSLWGAKWDRASASQRRGMLIRAFAKLRHLRKLLIEFERTFSKGTGDLKQAVKAIREREKTDPRGSMHGRLAAKGWLDERITRGLQGIASDNQSGNQRKGGIATLARMEINGQK